MYDTTFKRIAHLGEFSAEWEKEKWVSCRQHGRLRKWKPEILDKMSINPEEIETL